MPHGGLICLITESRALGSWPGEQINVECPRPYWVSSLCVLALGSPGALEPSRGFRTTPVLGRLGLKSLNTRDLAFFLPQLPFALSVPILVQVFYDPHITRHYLLKDWEISYWKFVWYLGACVGPEISIFNLMMQLNYCSSNEFLVASLRPLVGGVSRILLPLRNVHILIPGICEYVASPGKRDFAQDVIKLRLLRSEIILDYLEGLM